MLLMVSASSAISPFASTTRRCARSPSATAVTTFAMPRTWFVRLRAIMFTLSVRSFHVPEAPWTSACPPSLPSTPTSRATRVTSAAKLRSWSTVALTVSLISRISPRASTVIFCDRSPLATAVVTRATLRNWLVRLPTSMFTQRVISSHAPEAPSTSAWTPSLPSAPTSRATRVTSEDMARSWRTRSFTVAAMRWYSPQSGAPSRRSAISSVRSPSDSAPTTRPTSSIGHAIDSTSALTDSTLLAHVPTAPGSLARSSRRPSTPTERATRPSSAAKRSFLRTTALNAAATSAASGWSESVRRRTAKSPSRTASSAAASSTSICSSSALEARGRRRPPRTRVRGANASWRRPLPPFVVSTWTLSVCV